MSRTGLWIAMLIILGVASAFIVTAFLDRRRARQIEHDLSQVREKRRSWSRRM